MFHERVFWVRMATAIVDASAVVAAFFLAYWLRAASPVPTAILLPLRAYLAYLPLLLAIWLPLLAFFGLYESLPSAGLRRCARETLKAAATGFVIFTAALYVIKAPHLSRSFVLAIFALSAGLVIAGRAALERYFRYARSRGVLCKNALIVGTGRRAQRFMQMADEWPEWGLNIVGLVDRDAARVGQVIRGHRVIGSLEEMPRLLHDNVVDDVIFVVPRDWLDRVEGIIHDCETEGLRVTVAVDPFELEASQSARLNGHEFPLLTIEKPPQRAPGGSRWRRSRRLSWLRWRWPCACLPADARSRSRKPPVAMGARSNCTACARRSTRGAPTPAAASPGWAVSSSAAGGSDCRSCGTS